MEPKRISAVQFMSAFCLFSTDSRPNSLLGAPPSFQHQPQFSRWVLSGGSIEQRRDGVNEQTSGWAWFQVSGHPEESGADAGLLPDGGLWRRFVQLNEAALMQSETVVPCAAAWQAAHWWGLHSLSTVLISFDSSGPLWPYVATGQ